MSGLEVKLQTWAGDFTVEATFSLGAGVLVLYGPSGAGKSLTLEAIAGLRKATGRISLNGEELSKRPAHRRGVGFVPQHGSLFPFEDVAGNVGFGLSSLSKKARTAKVAGLLEEVGLRGRARARIGELSGGERQRVALARALAVDPKLLLLDEPFAALDDDARAELRRLLRALVTRHGIPAVFVTHDVEEALSVGDSLCRYERGKSVEQGPPGEVLARIRAIRISGFIDGDPKARDDGQLELRLREVKLRGPASLIEADADGKVRLVLPVIEKE